MTSITEPDYQDFPESLRDAVRRYVEDGIFPGGFLEAVICNDLKESFVRADIDNCAAIFEIVSWFYHEAPRECWGSPEQYVEWMAKHNAKRAYVAASSQVDDGSDV